VLLGFAATDFLITMTLSAADASTRLLENSYAPHFLPGHRFGDRRRARPARWP
jgi:hypothetical protein